MTISDESEVRKIIEDEGKKSNSGCLVFLVTPAIILAFLGCIRVITLLEFKIDRLEQVAGITNKATGSLFSGTITTNK